MNIEQIKKDWEQHCKEYGFKPKIYTESMGTSSLIGDKNMVVLKVLSHSSNNAIKIIPDLVTIIKNDRVESFFMQLISYDTEFKLFTTFYEKLVEASNE